MDRIQNIYRTFIWTFHHFSDFVIPRFCVGCGAEHETFCEKCRAAAFRRGANCLVCGARNATGALCAGSCKKLAPSSLKNIFWAGSYDETIKNTVWQLKYKKRAELASPLGIFLADKWMERQKSYEPVSFIAVPIPLHPAKRTERGFNQAELIAQTFSQRTNIEVALDILRKVKETGSQAKTANRADRLQNLKDAFAVNADVLKKYDGKTIILIDDVATTGATLIHASSALTSAGAKNIIGLVAAHG